MGLRKNRESRVFLTEASKCSLLDPHYLNTQERGPTKHSFKTIFSKHNKGSVTVDRLLYRLNSFSGLTSGSNSIQSLY